MTHDMIYGNFFFKKNKSQLKKLIIYELTRGRIMA